jgi:Mg2+-importing ATPase
MSNIKEDVNIYEMYSKEAQITKDEFIKIYNVKDEGLTTLEAEKKLHKFGLNEIKQAKPKKWYHYLLQSLFTPFNCILLGIVAILIYTDIYLASDPNYANIIVIAILVVTSTLLDFFEEYRSNKVAEKLKEIVATTTIVIRDGEKIEIPIKNIVLN